MAYPTRAPRSVRRAYSRDLARERVTIGIRGFRDGGSASEVVWKKHVPTVPARSGQARVNHKRNMRADFVQMLFADILMSMFVGTEMNA